LKFVPNKPGAITNAISGALGRVVLTIGGTGISKNDITVETAKKMCRKELEGFGDIFRMLSFREIGSGAIMSRAFCGVCGEKLVFCLPGSPKAVELGLRDIILKEAPHIVKHAFQSAGKH
jgi:molybdenum cofactor biosynthesis protein B